MTVITVWDYMQKTIKNDKTLHRFEKIIAIKNGTNHYRYFKDEIYTIVNYGITGIDIEAGNNFIAGVDPNNFTFLPVNQIKEI